MRPLACCPGYHDQCGRQESLAVAIDVTSKLRQGVVYLGPVLVHSPLWPYPPWATAQNAMQATAIVFRMYLGQVTNA